MRYYPLMYDILHKHVLIVGAGKVGARKALGLLEAPLGHMRIVDPAAIPASLVPFMADTRVCYEQRTFSASDIIGKDLVFAATSSREVNQHIADLCKTKNILCNIADAPDQSSFMVPAQVRQGPISIALSTQGASPALAKHLRKELELWLEQRYSRLAVVMQRLRPFVLALPGHSDEHAVIFRGIVDSPLAELLAANQWDEAQELLRAILPAELGSLVGELLYEL